MSLVLCISISIFVGICAAIPLDLLQRSLGNNHRHFESNKYADRRTTSKHGDCRLPTEPTTVGNDPNTNKNNKALKICDVLGGLDVTRLHSMDTRSLFSSAIEDVELLREYLTEATKNKARENADDLGDLESSLDYEARNAALGTNLTSLDTTVTAGLAWVDDRIDRRVERFVSGSPNMPHNGDKVSMYCPLALAIISIVSLPQFVPFNL